METQEVITSDGLHHAQSQLEYLSTVGRAKVAQYLYDAKESGDVIDNAAYEDAKNQQALVEGYEANPSAGRISNESPVGKALLGHKVGDLVIVSTPGGVKEYIILSIS